MNNVNIVKRVIETFDNSEAAISGLKKLAKRPVISVLDTSLILAQCNGQVFKVEVGAMDGLTIKQRKALKVADVKLHTGDVASIILLNVAMSVAVSKAWRSMTGSELFSPELNTGEGFVIRGW